MPDRTVPIVFKMIEPVAGFDERRTISADGISEADAVSRATVADFLTVVSREK
jgi:hypothetical protein